MYSTNSDVKLPWLAIHAGQCQLQDFELDLHAPERAVRCNKSRNDNSIPDGDAKSDEINAYQDCPVCDEHVKHGEQLDWWPSSMRASLSIRRVSYSHRPNGYKSSKQHRREEIAQEEKPREEGWESPSKCSGYAQSIYRSTRHGIFGTCGTKTGKSRSPVTGQRLSPVLDNSC